MESLKVYLWNVFFSRVPFYFIRMVSLKVISKFNFAKRVSLHSGVEFRFLKNLSVGGDTTINRNVYIDTRGGVEIGANVSISPDVKIITASHDIDSESFSLVVAPVVLEDYVWVGTGAIILPGVRLGKGSVVGAGSVVTKSVDDFSFVAGNPARYIRERNNNINYTAFWTPWFY